MNLHWSEIEDGDFAVLGDPIGHSWSPAMHNAAFSSLGLPYHYQSILVHEGELERSLEHLRKCRFKGVNITLPLKTEALKCCEVADQMVQSINTIRIKDSQGINTDIPGFLATLKNLNLINKNVLFLGAGGTAQALAPALSHSGYSVSIFNRTHRRAESLALSIGANARAVAEPDPSNCGLILNATSAGTLGEIFTVWWELAPDGALAYDLAYSAQLTPFLTTAAANGLSVMDGSRMLMEQGALSFEFWLNRAAPRDIMWEAICNQKN